jgi:hypothetical protein
VPALRTLFGVKKRPAGTHEPSPRLAVVIERPAYDLTLFTVHFGLLTRKGYTKGERVLRFKAIVHNTKTLKADRGLDKFPDIVARLAGMAGRFCATLDCAGTGFLPGGLLDELALPSQTGATRTGGIDVNKPRSRAVLAAALALAIAPAGLTAAGFAAKVREMTGQAGYTSRNAASDLRKLRAKHLAGKPGRTRRYLISPGAARIISAPLTLRDQVIAPLLAGVAGPRIRRTPRHWTDIDRHYQALRPEMMALSADLGIACGSDSGNDNILSIGEPQAANPMANHPLTGVIRGDLRDPDAVLRGAAGLLDFGQPAALLFLATLHHVADEDDPAAAVARYLPALAPGSYLVISHCTDEFAPEKVHATTAEARSRGAVFRPRGKDAILAMFNGRELLQPGVGLRRGRRRLMPPASGRAGGTPCSRSGARTAHHPSRTGSGPDAPGAMRATPSAVRTRPSSDLRTARSSALRSAAAASLTPAASAGSVSRSRRPAGVR